VICGMARLDADEVLVVGIRKGGTTKERIKRNFGMPSPEGYSQGAAGDEDCREVRSSGDRADRRYGGVSGPGRRGARTGRGHARNIREMSRLRVPTISVITGRAAREEPWRWP